MVMAVVLVVVLVVIVVVVVVLMVIVDFHSFLVWLGCGSSLTSQHFACPVSLNLGDQSNSAL